MLSKTLTDMSIIFYHSPSVNMIIQDAYKNLKDMSIIFWHSPSVHATILILGHTVISPLVVNNPLHDTINDKSYAIQNFRGSLDFIKM